MVQVVLRSSEVINLVIAYYFSEMNFKISLSDGATLTLEDKDNSIAFEVFKLLLDNNLMNSDNVEFINLNPNSTSAKAKTSPKGGTKGVQSKKVKKAKESKEKKSGEPTVKEKILEYLCMIYPEKLSISEIADRLNLKYTSVTSAINRLYNAGEVLKDKKHYYAKPRSAEGESKVNEAKTSGTEEKLSEGSSETNNTESGEGVEGSSQNSEENFVPETEETLKKGSIDVNPEATEEPTESAEPATSSVETQKEVEVKLPEYSLLEKAETMKQLFADSNNEEVIRYIFFLRKRNFSVDDARKKFQGPNAEILSNVIKILFEKGIIILDENIPSAVRYKISPMWRIYANLLKNEVPMEEGALRTVAELGVKEFQKLIRQALQEEIIVKTVEKRVTRYAIITDATEKEAE